MAVSSTIAYIEVWLSALTPLTLGEKIMVKESKAFQWVVHWARETL
jgi:hypothetical protein